MRVFLTQKIDTSEALCTQLVQVDSELTAVLIVVVDAEKLLKELQDEMQTTKVEARRMGEEKEAT